MRRSARAGAARQLYVIGDRTSWAQHRFRPLSATVAVPVFAFMAAGVAVGGLTGLRESVSDRVAIGIVIGLLVGKPIGILAAT